MVLDRMITWVALIASVAVVSMAGPASASTTRFTQDVAGDVFVCQGATYTVISGHIEIFIHEVDNSFAARVLPKDVVLSDGAGGSYEIRGSSHSGGSLNYQQRTGQETFTFHMNILGDRGVVGTVSITAHFSDTGSNFWMDRGTCEEP